MSQPTTSVWPPHDHGITVLEELKKKIELKKRRACREYEYIDPERVFNAVLKSIDYKLRELKK